MDDLISEFLVETSESLDALDLDIVKLEQDPDDQEIIGNIFRVMHTIKGTCGFLGLSRLESVAHAAENIMDKLRDGDFKVTPDITSLILEAIDAIKEIIDFIEKSSSEPEGNDANLISRLNECADSNGVISGKGGGENIAPEPKMEEDSIKTPDLDGEIDFEPIPAPSVVGVIEEVSTEIEEIPDKKIDEEIQPVAKVAEVQKPAKATVEKKSPSGSGQSIRVSIDVLEELMQMVGELVLTRNQLLQMARDQEEKGQDSSFATPLQRLNHITTELQEGVMQTRMQPIGNAWAKFPRLIRDLALDLNKKIELKMIGAETDLDRQMLEAIRDPLTHMVRNSTDHGIELPDERLAAGKAETGVVTLSAYHEGGHIIIKIADDGKGLNVEKIKEKAIENGLATELELNSMSDKQIYQFVFRAGFSTAEKVTSVSGRGVGMDVVVSNINKIGGTVELNSTVGKGSEFLIKLPLTLAIMPVLIVKTASETFAIPQIRVSEIVKVDNGIGNVNQDKNVSGHSIETINNAPVLRLRGRLLPLVSLSDILNIERIPEDITQPIDKSVSAEIEIDSVQDSSPIEKVGEKKTEKESFIVVCDVGSQNFGILVDKVYHTEEIVVKPRATLIQDLEVYAGCTILGDGSVIMILDPNAILKLCSVMDAIDDDDIDGNDDDIHDESLVSFLIFKSWDKTPKAMPLDLVSRLEEIDVANIEWSGSQRVIQYRDGLMNLITLDPSTEIGDSGIYEVIVFHDEDKILGLVVEEIVDISRQEMDVKSLVGVEGMLGSIIINETTTDLVDISYFFAKIFNNWVGRTQAIEADDNVTEETKKRLLLVDDSPFFRKFMKPILLVSGYSVTTAESGLDALNILEKRNANFDIILTDINMPEMDGIEFIKKCKGDSRFAEIPFIALTSQEEGKLGDIKELGFSGYVSKSNREMLVSVIDDVMSSIRADELA